MEMNTERKRILFADDDPEIREVVRILLEHEGFEVIEASNGKEAVEKSGGSVDLIILDGMMPGEVRDSGLSGDKEKTDGTHPVSYGPHPGFR